MTYDVLTWTLNPTHSLTPIRLQFDRATTIRPRYDRVCVLCMCACMGRRGCCTAT